MPSSLADQKLWGFMGSTSTSYIHRPRVSKPFSFAAYARHTMSRRSGGLTNGSAKSILQQQQQQQWQQAHQLHTFLRYSEHIYEVGSTTFCPRVQDTQLLTLTRLLWGVNAVVRGCTARGWLMPPAHHLRW